MLASDMAEHTMNSRASLLVTTPIVSSADPLSTARCTLVGHLRLVDDPSSVRHPYAGYYVDFTDFAFWRLEVNQCRYVGGFGHMSWVDAAAYGAAAVDPLVDATGEIIEHMNDDHADANLAYAQALAGLAEATAAAMVGIDRYGLTLQATVGEGSRLARVPFPEPLTDADEARPAIVELLAAARKPSAVAGDR